MNWTVFGYVLGSFVVASAINVYPLSFELARYRPMMMVVVLLFWALYQPRMIGIGVAFCVGLGCDLLLDTHLGYQAFCAVIGVFVVRLLAGYVKHLTMSSAWTLVAIALTVYCVVFWGLQSFASSQLMLVGFRGYVVSVLLFPVVWQLLFPISQKLDG